MVRYLLLILIILSSITVSNAQVYLKSIDSNDFLNYVKYHDFAETEENDLPYLNKRALLKEDKIIGKKMTSTLKRFGVKHNIELRHDDRQWSRTDYGYVWKQSFRSPNGVSLNFMFDQLYLPEGAELFIYNDNKDLIYGPVTAQHNKKSGRFNTDIIPSTDVTIEVFCPEPDIDRISFKLTNVVQGYKSINKLYGDGPSCSIDVSCPEGTGWEDESDAVGLIIVDGTRHCSGALVNNGCQDYTPLFLTAFHCADDNKDDVYHLYLLEHTL